MMAGALRNRGVTHPVLAIHDMVYREEMGRTLAHVLRQPAIQPRTRARLMEQLDPRTRNLEEFTNPDPLPEPLTTPGAQPANEEENTGESNPAESAEGTTGPRDNPQPASNPPETSSPALEAGTQAGAEQTPSRHEAPGSPETSELPAP